MSTLNVDKVDPSTGTALEIGSSGDTITIPSGATIVNSGTATGFGAALTGSTNNTVTTVTAANAIQGEANLTFTGSTLTIKPGSNVHQLKLEQDNGTDYWSLHCDSSGGPLSFNRYTGGSEIERLSVASLGDATLTGGDLIFGTAGKGVCLGVTTNTDANTLDDYEEGTWTPAWEPATSGSVTAKDPAGTYTKIGNIVYFLCRLATNGSSSPVGDLKISGLPFTQSGGPGGNEGGGPIVACDTWTAGEFPTVFKCASSGTDEAFMMQRGDSDGQIVVMDSATMAINYNYSSFSAVGWFKT